MTADRAHRILLAHGVQATASDAARLLDTLVPLARAALRVGAGVQPSAPRSALPSERRPASTAQPVP